MPDSGGSANSGGFRVVGVALEGGTLTSSTGCGHGP